MSRSSALTNYVGSNNSGNSTLTELGSSELKSSKMQSKRDGPKKIPDQLHGLFSLLLQKKYIFARVMPICSIYNLLMKSFSIQVSILPCVPLSLYFLDKLRSHRIQSLAMLSNNIPESVFEDSHLECEHGTQD